jgi:tetratricopeptide (TPR) repeat protein
LIRMKIFQQAILAAILLFCASFVPGQADSRPAATWQVQKYDLAVTVPQAETDRSITVKANLDVKNVSGRPATTLTLRMGSAAEVSAVSVAGSQVDFTKSEEKINSSTSLQRIVLRLPSVQPNAAVSVNVDYRFSVKDNSGVGAISPTGVQFLPTSFWYPTPNSWFFARGADYAPFRVQVNAPNMTSISAGASATGHFDNKLGGQPFFLSGKWDNFSVGDVAVFVPVGAGEEERRRASELAQIAAEARTFAASLLGPAPEAPLRIVAAKRGGGFADGGTILVDDGVLRRPKADSLTVAHIADAIAKMWLGGSVVVTNDGYGVIREGLTRHIANQFLEKKYGSDVADIERLRQRAAYSAVVRRDSPLNMTSPLDDYYYTAVTNKGAMIWRLMAKKAGESELFSGIRSLADDGVLTLAEIRSANAAHKEFLDNAIDQVTDMNLMAGLPAGSAGEWKVALRNTGSIDATVNVEALLANGERVSAPATVRSRSFGEVVFKTPQTIKRVEIDPEKFYPQTDYSDDVAPRETTDSDLLLTVKRSFDKQEFPAAEAAARSVLSEYPRFDDVRILLARSLLSQNKVTEAEREFRAVLEEKLPSARSIAWAFVGLADAAARTGRTAEAIKNAESAIAADAEYGATLAARNIRKRMNSPLTADESVKAFFAQFDRAAASNRKADLEALAMAGEVSRFTSGLSGQAVEWKTTPLYVDRIDSNNVWVETSLAIKLLNKDPESGTAVYRLTRVLSGWKLSGVDIFEVR